jgi:hypothetical protein
VKLTKEVKKFGGVLTVLWHNTHLSHYKYTGWRELYVRIMNHGFQEHAWMQSCSEIINRAQNG